MVKIKGSIKRILWIALPGLLCLVAAASFLIYDTDPSETETPNAESAPVQRNLVWQRDERLLKQKMSQNAAEPSHDPPAGLLVRLEENNDRNFLVKFSEPQEFYRYIGETKSIVPVTEAEWLAGKREIACRERERNESKFLDLDEGTKVLRLRNGVPISTFGRYALGFLESPSKRLAVVLSAPGPRTKGSAGFIFGGQSGQILGGRYAQVLNITNAVYVTEPLELTVVNEFPNYWFCWLDNEKYVLAYEVEYTGTKRFELDFHVIETER